MSVCACRWAQAAPAANGTPPPTIALVPRAPASAHCKCMEPPRPLQKPWARPRISARVRCNKFWIDGLTGACGSIPSGIRYTSALARNWWCPRCEPLTSSAAPSGTIEPTAPPSWPMLECAGPCTRPSPASSSTVSSKARIRCNWLSMVPSSAGSACFQSASVVLSSTHGDAGDKATLFGMFTSPQRTQSDRPLRAGTTKES